ncbi:cellulase-like family protein [Dictyobacter aurantiacus]|uniref:Glycoside hydrolase family 5 domain-containing protein n=1 Tax=Dictyobacter aurantiacus TaxID=1936993 RepID=A0A401ZM04_9CHLR|nr:cellulase-like family protein [Dictyobacter aurantiacus]GCE07862.1 hypothetical protein KDAU_51910 [Dictyobacter aurantiacus]
MHTSHYQIPEHLPQRLTISLWDFSWYTMTMPGEPFADLDRAFAEAVERGYNTVRICAMPYLLFGDHGRDTSALTFSNLGGTFGQRTRWYNTRGGATLNGREHFLRFFEAAKRHNVFVILSSWEYQQSPSFLSTSDWYQDLMAIAPQERFKALARAMGRMITFLKEHQLDDRIAYAELHNEVELTKLREVAQPGEDTFAAEKPYLEQAVSLLRDEHPDILMTVCYGGVPLTHMHDLPQNMQVAHFHLYIYGVLEQLFQEAGLRGNEGPFPTELAREILRKDAPPFETWAPPSEEAWKTEATGVSRRLFYIHDWADPDKWDLWLYDHYGDYRVAMRQVIDLRLQALAAWAEQRNIPAVIGEGYVGYTPLLTNFEEGPVGKDIAEYAVAACQRLNFWGYILCSNAAPHHPFWHDVAWQQRVNAQILGAAARNEPAVDER